MTRPVKPVLTIFGVLVCRPAIRDPAPVVWQAPPYPAEPAGGHPLVLGGNGGGSAAAGLAVERAGLVHRRLEKKLAVTERRTPLANRHAAIGFAFDTAINRDDLIGGAFDLDDSVHQNLTTAVH